MKTSHRIAAALGAAAAVVTGILSGAFASAAAPVKDVSAPSITLDTSAGKIELAGNYPRQGEIRRIGDTCYQTRMSGGNGGPRWGYYPVPCPPGM
jgi:hypothetical protein